MKRESAITTKRRGKHEQKYPTTAHNTQHTTRCNGRILQNNHTHDTPTLTPTDNLTYGNHQMTIK